MCGSVDVDFVLNPRLIDLRVYENMLTLSSFLVCVCHKIVNGLAYMADSPSGGLENVGFMEE